LTQVYGDVCASLELVPQLVHLGSLSCFSLLFYFFVASISLEVVQHFVDLGSLGEVLNSQHPRLCMP